MQSPTPVPDLLPCDAQGSLLSVTRTLLINDERSRTQLSTELGVPFHWLNAFAQGAIDAPNVNRIQFIYEALSGRKLKL